MLGNLGNEKADSLAKEGARKFGIYNYYHYPNKCIKDNNLEKYISLWQTRGRSICNYISQVNIRKIYVDFYLNQVVTEHRAIPKFQN